jgi:DNA segregation ATPase FtsK/SpoIIIE, S-DNA-T family
MAKRKKKNASSNGKKIAGVLLFVLALLALVALVTHSRLDDARITGQIDRQLDPFDLQYRNQGGMLGAYLSYSLMVIMGWLAYFIPAGLMLLALRLFASSLGSKLELHVSLLFVVALLGSVIFNVHILVKPTVGLETAAIGGYLVAKLTLLAIKVLGDLGTYLVACGLILILLMTYTSITPLLSMRIRLPGGAIFRGVYTFLARIVKSVFSFGWLGGEDESEEDEVDEDHADDAEDVDAELESSESEGPESDAPLDSDEGEGASPRTARKKATLKRPPEPVQIKSIQYSYPGLELLQEPVIKGQTVTNDELDMTSQMLKETLETFQVTIDGPISTFPGPIITRFEFKPAAGVKINRIVSLADDLALALKAKRIRIVAPIPGKAAVGVEIPNRNPQSVFLRDIIASEMFTSSKSNLPLALGKTISGKPFVADLAKMPHLLIAGATGSGKSVCMNALITSLIYKLHPLHVRFIFIDPKMLELSIYKGIPHLGRPVVTEPKRAESVLSDIVVEMENRYRRLANATVRNIEDYNSRQESEETKLPYIVVFVDELADLMMSATSSRVEVLITRLAQMARAVGIHLILATQRPSVDVITGLIKANFPARIAFQVSSKVDSRTIIDQNGAEKLLGAGDMLFLTPGQPEPQRIHGAYISSDETERIVSFINEQGLEPMRLEGISQSNGEPTEGEVDLGDPLFREACEVCVRHKQGSVSLLQRRLGIGYQRAARLIDKLEQAGVVSPFDGSKAREVLVDQPYLDAMFGAGAKGPGDTAK